MLQHSSRGWHGSGSGFGSRKTVPTVPVWETDLYTPQVPGGAALTDNSVPAVYKIEGF